MKPSLQTWARRVVPIAGALVLGALAFALFGNTPDSAVTRDNGQARWSLPTPDARDLAASDTVWTSRTPWGAPAAAAAGQALPPPPVPVAVVAEAPGFEAVFVVPGNSTEVRVGVGDALPDGGQVTAISRFHVGWTDGQGVAQEQELFGDPLRPLTAAPAP